MVRGGEIVEVEGGHIVRRKDRHSKVCTAKGPRDRRVRLSAHTAIQFYDVQDRLGYDTPSKAVDWLINKSKSAIDQLALLPPWKPTPQPPIQHHDARGSGSTFLQLDNDTLRTFFPATTSSSFLQFQTYPHDFLSRTTTQNLCLSLQSLQDPVLLHNDHVLFPATGFDDNNNNNNNMVAWDNNNNNDDDGGGGGGGGFVFNDGYEHGQSQFFSQREPLQSNNTPSIRAWIDAPSFVAADHRHLSPAAGVLYQSSPSTAAFAAPGGFSGFRLPAPIWGEEEHGGVSTKPSSAFSDSRR